MSRFPGRVERRLFEAVLVVLAGCGRPNADPVEPNDRVFAAPPTDAAVVAVADPASTPAGHAKTICATYKSNARVDRTRARQAPPPHEGHPLFEHATWDPKSAVAVCTIVHERTNGTVTVMHTPHWCPQGGGKPPGPSPVQVPGEKLLVERAKIRADGTVAESKLEWTASSSMENFPRHNCGRRFEGLALDAADGDDPGSQLAAMAELEAASIPAFERLVRELAAHGAPHDLVRRARIAMLDEVRHARVMTALARRYGKAPRAFTIPLLPCRTLEDIAHENAIEGCVREAYGALVATYQAERARPELRAAFAAIARDERSHAELAEDVHAWILDRLDRATRDAVTDARACAEDELRASTAAYRECAELGLPGANDAAALYTAYFA